MKFPNHLILDFNYLQTKTTTQYWALLYLINLNSKPFFINSLVNFKQKTHIFNKIYSSQNWNKFKLKTNNNLLICLSKLDTYYNFKTTKKQTFNFLNFFLINKKFNSSNFFNVKPIFNSYNNINRLFNIYFLRKEKIYTKLKYSRVPQYDIVSGGLSVLFCAFLGFLVCEKYGFELLDSGEFYFLLMYIIFFCFFLRLLIKIFLRKQSLFDIFNGKYFFYWLLSVFFFLKNNFL